MFECVLLCVSQCVHCVCVCIMCMCVLEVLGDENDFSFSSTFRISHKGLSLCNSLLERRSEIWVF